MDKNKVRKNIAVAGTIIVAMNSGGCTSQSSGDRELIGFGIMRDGGYKHTHIVGENKTADVYFNASEAAKRTY